jgi:hypothetical protein
MTLRGEHCMRDWEVQDRKECIHFATEMPRFVGKTILPVSLNSQYVEVADTVTFCIFVRWVVSIQECSLTGIELAAIYESHRYHCEYQHTYKFTSKELLPKLKFSVSRPVLRMECDTIRCETSRSRVACTRSSRDRTRAPALHMCKPLQ